MLLQVQSTCRTLVKEATESKRSDETLKLLYVAINGLRAICPLLEEEKKKEAIIKILYHAVTTASDVCVKSKNDSSVHGRSFTVSCRVPSAWILVEWIQSPNG